MIILLGFIIALIVGTLSIFLVVGRFSPNPPDLQRSFYAALIIEGVSLVFSGIPFFGWMIFAIVGIFVMYKFLEMEGMSTLFALMLYGLVKAIMIFLFAYLSVKVVL
jgi:hypothetical protein